jgi:hypothetical protein
MQTREILPVFSRGIPPGLSLGTLFPSWPESFEISVGIGIDIECDCDPDSNTDTDQTIGWNQGSPMNGYWNRLGGTKFSLMERGETQRCRFSMLPALSLVPEALEPPNGCCPTTAPVGLSLM